MKYLLLSLALLSMTACQTAEQKQAELIDKMVAARRNCEKLGYAMGSDQNLECAKALFSKQLADEQATSNRLRTIGLMVSGGLEGYGNSLQAGSNAHNNYKPPTTCTTQNFGSYNKTNCY